MGTYDKKQMLQIAWDCWWVMRSGTDSIQARQRERLANMLAFVRQHSRFYRDKYRHLPEHVADVRKLPPVMKPELLTHFDDWVTDPEVTRSSVQAFVSDKSLVGHYYLGKYFVCTTSGTTGVPTVLVQDAGMMALSPALELARAIPGWGLAVRDWAKFLALQGRVAAVFVTGGHFQGIASMARRYLDDPRRKNMARMFSALSPISEIVQGLNEYQPAMLAGYPQALALLAQEQESCRLRINPLLVFPTGETFTASMRGELERAFHASVRQSYGSSEMPVIAYDCGQGGLHVNADWVILEPVDENYQPVPVGQPSHKVLLTNLMNRVQPIIRYEMGDSVTVSAEPCPCKSPLPSIRVEGRSDEILRFAGTRGQTVAIIPMALWSVLEDTPGVYRFQAIQTAPTQLDIRLQARNPEEDGEVWDAVKQRARNFLDSHGLTNVRVERSRNLPMPNPVSGKFRHIWSDFRNEEETGSVVGESELNPAGIIAS